MNTRVCFINDDFCGIAETLLVHGNQTTADKPEPVMPRFARSFLPVALDALCEDEAEAAAHLPRMAVAFTVGGPLVYHTTKQSIE